MIEIKKAFQNIRADEFNELLDVPVWLALLAAYEGDGIISENEKAEAVKLAHMRTYTAPKSLQEFYRLVDGRFAQRFEQLDHRLPTDIENKKVYIRAQVHHANDLLNKLDLDIASGLQKSLASFYKHVFNSDKSFFQYFALPVFSNRLDKHSGKINLGSKK